MKSILLLILFIFIETRKLTFHSKINKESKVMANDEITSYMVNVSTAKRLLFLGFFNKIDIRDSLKGFYIKVENLEPLEEAEFRNFNRLNDVEKFLRKDNTILQIPYSRIKSIFLEKINNSELDKTYIGSILQIIFEYNDNLYTISHFFHYIQTEDLETNFVNPILEKHSNIMSLANFEEKLKTLKEEFIKFSQEFLTFKKIIKTLTKKQKELESLVNEGFQSLVNGGFQPLLDFYEKMYSKMEEINLKVLANELKAILSKHLNSPSSEIEFSKVEQATLKACQETLNHLYKGFIIKDHIKIPENSFVEFFKLKILSKYLQILNNYLELKKKLSGDLKDLTDACPEAIIYKPVKYNKKTVDRIVGLELFVERVKDKEVIINDWIRQQRANDLFTMIKVNLK
jgi:hypothetical protein